jgi:hypothetical protein
MIDHSLCSSDIRVALAKGASPCPECIKQHCVGYIVISFSWADLQSSLRQLGQPLDLRFVDNHVDVRFRFG